MFAGALLTAFGILGLVFLGGIHYVSSEHFPRDSATQVTVHQEKILTIRPVVSGLALAGGLALMIVAARK
jgi:hypothetical protein